jgi:GAF domain-containing protein
MSSQKMLDTLTQRAADVIHVPVACLTLVNGEERLVVSCDGLSAPLAILVTWPLCQHLLSSRLPLAIPDVRRHPLMNTQPAVQDGMVMAFAGAPLLTRRGHAIGTLFVMDPKPRIWTPDEIELLCILAAQAMHGIEARQAAPARWEKAAIWSRVWSASFSMTLRT